MASNWALHPAHIRTLLLSDTRDMDAPTEEWVTVLDDTINAHGVDALVAWTHAQEDHDDDAVFRPEEVEDEFERVYRKHWDSDWEFARDGWADELQEYGDKGEQKGRQSFMNDLSSYVDWRAVANSPLLSDYTTVRLGEDGDAGVHVFEMDA